MDYVVVGPLQEAGVNGHEGQHAVFGEAAGEGDGVALGDTDVKGALGMLLHKRGDGGAREHRCRHPYDILPLVGEAYEFVAEDVLPFLTFGASDALLLQAGGGVEASRGVPGGRILLGGLVAFPFDGVQMQYARSLHLFYIEEDAHEIDDIMAVKWSEISDIQALEDILLTRDKGFDRIVEAQDAPLAGVGDESFAAEEAIDLVAHAVVARGGVEFGQIAMECPDVVIDTHIVVVEHDKQVIGVVGGVVESLEGESARD